MVVWNDAGFIEKCVESVIDHVDRIVVIDGVFEDFPHNPDEPGYSTDGTLEYISGLDKPVSLAICPELSEVDKRNMYLVAEPGEWYLHLDSDEWVQNPEVLDNLPEDKDVLFCPMLRDGGATSFYARLFRHVEGLHYEGLHYRLLDGEGRLVSTLRQAGDDYRSGKSALTIIHDREKRPEERKKLKRRYYNVLTAHERGVKEMLRYG